MGKEIGWSQQSKLLYQIKKQLKRTMQLHPGNTTTSSTTTTTTTV